MFKSTRTSFLSLSSLFVAIFLTMTAAFAQSGPKSPEALGETLVSSINAKNKNVVQSLIHPQVVSYLRLTDPAMLDNIVTSLMQLKIPENYKMGVISMDELTRNDSKIANYDKATHTHTMMCSSEYYRAT